MSKLSLLTLILTILVSYGCNNPSGGSSIAPNHTPLLQPPGPFDFVSVRSSGGASDIEWGASSRADNYEFFMGTDPSNVTTPVSVCTGLITSCRLTGLDPDTIYYFNVKATNAAGSKFVNSMATGLSVGSFDITGSSPSDTVINLSWGNSSNATSYNVVFGTASGSYTGRRDNVTSPYVITGLTNGTLYFVRVEAVNGNGGFALSDSEISARPFGPLGPPQDLLATATPGTTTLNWTALGGATSYEIWDSAGVVLIGTSVTNSFTHNHASNGTPYTYKVRALNGFNGAFSAVVSSQSISNFSMASAVAGPLPGQATVSWPTPVTGATVYDIRYGSNPLAPNFTVTGVTSPHVFSGLTGGLTYHFQVVARNTVGSGASLLSDNQLSATPVAPIAPPSGLTASATPSGITLSWTAVPGASDYRVYRNTSSGGHTFLASTGGANTYLDTTANPDGTTYFYVVRSFNGLESANSSEVSKRPINNFSLTSATVATFSSADLTWAGATGATGYDILWGTSSGNYTGSSPDRISPATLTGLSASTTYYVVIRAKNAAGGGTTLLSNERTFTTGTLFPTVTITSAPLINNANKASYSLSGTCTEEGRTVSLNVGGAAASTTCTSLAWALTMDVTAAADSPTRSVIATHTNSGGNSDTDTVNVVKDTVNPTVSITVYPAINDTNKASYTVSGSCSENTRSVSVSVGGITATPTCSGLSWSATVNASGLSDSGSVPITADHTDAAGNVATQASRTVVKDTVPPSVAISSAPTINNANKASYPVSGTCSETGENVTVQVGGVSATVSCTLLTWSANLNVTAVADAGGVVVTANHSDSAGNAATPASTLVLKDTVNPSVAITNAPAIISTNESAYTVSGTCSENGQSVSVSVGGVTATPNCSAGAWSATVDTSSVPDGPSVTVSATHVDVAANSTTVSTTVVKQTALPTVAITSNTAINNTNKAAYPVSGTCSHNGRPVTVNVGGVNGTPTCSGGAWSVNLNVTAVSDNGSVAVTADHSDSVGNNAVQATTTVLKDTVLPTVAITSSPAINNANKSSYTVSGTCSENSRTVSVNVSGVSATPTCSGLAWSATVDASGVADGASRTITADHTDLAGNSAVQASVNVAKDTVIPTVSITTYPVINNNNKASYTVSGACSENSRVVSVSVGGVTASPTCTSLAWSATLNVTSLADSGSVSITADHTDAAGNPATQATRSVVKDTAIPTVAITSSPVVNNANKNSYTVSGTCSDSGENVSVAVGSTTGNTTCSILTWTVTLNVSANADSSSLLVTADHTDAAGNSAIQAGVTVVKDTVNPTVAISSSPAINNANKSSYPVSGTCSENTQTVSISVGGVTASPTCSGLAWSATLDVSGISDSPSVSVTANHSDSAGNSATQASTTVVKQTALPTVAITSSPVINNANKNAYTVSGNCSESGRAVSVSVGGVTGSPNCAGTTWSVTLNVSGLADSGSVAITADHSDVVGNNATQASTSVVKDTVNPLVAITSSPTINSANVAAYTVSGTCSENGRQVSVLVGAVAGTPNCSGTTWSVTLNVSAVADGGAVSVTANHTDAAGNSATQASASVVKDTSNPTVAITVFPVINNANKAAYTFSGTCSENGRTVSVNAGGITAGPNCSAGSWSATLDVTAVADNASVTLTADHSDANGNTATQATRTVLKDTTNPTVAITSAPVINNANKSAYVVSGTCSENSRTVTVLVGSVSGTPNCSSNTWTTTLNVTSVADGGAISVTANHSDAAGNNATQASTTVLKDTVNPTVAITSSPVINSANATAYTVSGTCTENGQVVAVSVGGVIGSPACSGGAWSSTLNVSGLTDGTITITANHTDAAGNNATQASTTVNKTTTLPTVSISAPVAINNTNKSSYPIGGTCSVNGQPVTVSVGGISGTPNCSGGAWSTILNVSGLADSGTVAITADHSDGVGNDAIQATASVVKDTFIPTVAISSSPSINNANKATYTVSGTCSEDTRTVTLNVGGVGGSGTCNTGAWSATVNVTSVGDGGSVSVTANHTDAAGNSATQASTTVLKDTSDPTVAITNPGAINNINKSAFTVTGSCSENSRTVTVSVGGVNGTPTCTSNAWSATLDVSGLSDSGTVSITANHSDLAGNPASQASLSVVKDTVIPTVAITSSPVINDANKANYTVSGTCSENTRLVSVNVGGVIGTIACSAGIWSRNLNVTSVSDSGSVAVTADHTDAAGNNATQATASVVKDTAIPTVAISAPAIINNANKAVYPVSGTCSENTRTVTISVGGVGSSATCTTGSYSTTVDVTALGDGGSISITANHTDAAGNAATQASVSTSKDTTAPTVAITSSPAINNTNKSSYPVGGTCSENTRVVSVSVGGIAATPTCTTGIWSTSVDVSGLSDGGSISITANHTDAAGNTATQATASVVKDTVLPTVSIASAPSINNANKASYPVSGACSENGQTVTVSVGSVSGTPTCTALAWSVSLNVNTVPDGASVTVTANHSDLAGNAATTATTTVLKDTSNPNVAITSSPVMNLANVASYLVSGTCSENSRTVTVSVGGIGATPNCSGGAWSTTVNGTSLTDGSVTITADHTDAAGNTATQANVSITKDTSAPTVSITSAPAINNSNKGTYPVGGTCSENGRTVTVVVGGVSGTVTCGTGTWSRTFNVTGVADGPSILITADLSDVNGNNATQATTTVLKDTVIPTVTIGSAPTINNSNVTNYPVSGTCSENGRTVSVTVGSVSGTPSCNTGAWSVNLNVTAVTDGGSISVTANHTDLAGNAANQASTTVVKDTSNPTVAISFPSPINNTNKGGYVVSGSCSENGRAVTVSVGGVGATPNCSGNAWMATVDVTGVADGGSISITADHVDANGNSATQATAATVKDTVIPTVTIGSAPSINNANKANYIISGTCSENGRPVSVNVGGVTGSPSCSTGAWSATLNVTAVADSGSVSVTANHSDAAGNSATQASTTVIKDTGIPTVAINAPAVIRNSNKASYTVSGTCSETGRAVTVNIGGIGTSDTCTLLTWSVTINATGIPDSASVLITADHSDAAGNPAVQAGTTVVKDTVDPTITIGSAPTITFSNRTAYTVTGTCSENGRTVSVSVGSVNASVTCTTGSWSSGPLNVSGIADSASVAVSANHTDSAGNSATANTTVVKDATNPTVAITSSPTINIANVASYTISGTCSENGRTVLIQSGAASIPTTCNSGNWTLTADVTAFSDSAALSISATHTDVVGNSAVVNTSVLKDTVAPTVALSTAAGNPTYGAFTVRATFSEAVTGMAAVDFVLSNGAGSAFTAVSGVLYDITVSPGSEGAVNVDLPAAAAIDVAGNPSTAATQLSRTYVAPAVLAFNDSSTYDFGTVSTGDSADVTMLILKTNTPDATSLTETTLSAPFSFKGGSYPGTGGTCGTTINFDCTIVLTYAPTNIATHNGFVTLQYFNGASTVSISRAITGTGALFAPTKITVDGPAGITTNQCIPYTITSRASNNSAANVSSNVTVNLLVNNGTGTFYSNATCATTITSTTINSGTNNRTVYFRSTTAGQNLTLVFNPTTSLDPASKVVSTSTGPTRLNINPPAEIERSTCYPLRIELTDAGGVVTGRSTPTSVTLSKTGGGSMSYYSDNLCLLTTTTTTIPANTEFTTVYVRSTSPASVTLTVSSVGLTSDSATVSFVATLTWWNSSFLKRLPITIDNADQASAHTDMQVLVRLDNTRISYADFLAAGQDVRFTLSDHTTVLSYHIEKWDSAGESLIWVRIPTIAASSQMIIYMYYNNTAASDAQNLPATWAGFQGVWNGDKSGANFIDATGSGRDGVPAGTVAQVDGPSGKGMNFTGASSLNTNTDLSVVLGGNATMSFWIRTTQAGNANFYNAPAVTGIRSDTTGFNEVYYGWIRNTGAIGIQAKNGGTPAVSNFSVRDGVWRHVSMTRNSSSGQIRFFVNGVYNSVGTSGTGAVTNAFTSLGVRIVASGTSAATLFFVGDLDGIRMNNSIISDDRIRGEYKFSIEGKLIYGATENF